MNIRAATGRTRATTGSAAADETAPNRRRGGDPCRRHLGPGRGCAGQAHEDGRAHARRDEEKEHEEGRREESRREEGARDKADTGAGSGRIGEEISAPL